LLQSGGFRNDDGTVTDQCKGIVDINLFLIDPVAGILKKTIHVTESVMGDDKSSNDWKILGRYVYSDSTDVDQSSTSTLGRALDLSIKNAGREIVDFQSY